VSTGDAEPGREHAPPTRMQFLRPFTTRVVNPVTRRFARWLPGFAIVRYRGRRSGKVYRTPINVFRHDDAYVFALTYGPDVQWVRNVLASGRAELEIRRHRVRLEDPEIILDPTRRLIPLPVRLFLGVLRVTSFLRMRIADDEIASPPQPRVPAR
jgi:deazaflavin-dependent oxidoreductase (nitroreductase family)